MLQLRKGVFETNSSSVHAFCVTEGSARSIPKTADLTEDSLQMAYVRDWILNLDAKSCKAVVLLLYSKGVERIIYNGANQEFEKAVAFYQGKQVEPDENDYYSSNNIKYNTIIDFIFGTGWDYIGRDTYLDGSYYTVAVE